MVGRDLTELVVVNIGYEMNVIPPSLFAMLVIMALSTTMVTTPWLSYVMRPKRSAPTGGDDRAVVLPESEAARARRGERTIVLPASDDGRARADDPDVVMPGTDGAPETALHSARSAR